MRQIKFRAWDEKRLSKPFLLSDVLTAVYTVGHGYRTIPFAEEKIMQFTGLLDKNGKEIYEGDVVKSDYGYGHPNPTTVDLESIFYWKGECCISDNIEIIGNIHENPELLK